MKFGKQLELGIHDPWRDYYLQYGRMKRIIKRHKFLAEKMESGKVKAKHSTQLITKSQIEMSYYNSLDSYSPSSDNEDEETPLQADDAVAAKKQKKSKTIDPAKQAAKKSGDVESKSTTSGKALKIPIGEDPAEFFPFLRAELDRINKFFIGKLAELRIGMQILTSKRDNPQLSHHTSAETELFKLRDLYIDVKALESFCELNKIGCYKIVKKYDKTMNENTLDDWMETINQQPFAASTDVSALIDSISALVSRDKLLSWELFAADQKAANAELSLFHSIRFNELLLSLSVLAFTYFILPMNANYSIQDPVACRCLSLLSFVVTLWITQAIPYFATALLVPVLIVLMRVLKDPKLPGEVLSSEASAEFITSNMFNHTSFLLLGGYTISSAFSRCQLELRIASILQSNFGHQPKLFIFMIMMVGLFLSAWISNHTAPILCTSILLPIVRDLPTDSRFSRALLLGLAFACNFGGMLTPISSLQNVLASTTLEQAGLPVSFGLWIMVAFPFGFLCTLVAWAVIMMYVRPDDITSVPVIVYERKANVFSTRNIVIVSLSLLTMIAFATSSYTVTIFGDISIISIIFLVTMFGTGMLSEVDFNSLSWHTLSLVGGGNALGKAVASSGLLNYIAGTIIAALPMSNQWLALVCVLFFCGTVAVFVSHTVASIILMPVVFQVGTALNIPEVVVIGAAWAISAAMALPFSSFPNVNSLLIVDDFQKPYLNVKDFIWTGMPMSVLSVMMISTLGYIVIVFFVDN